MTLLLPKLMYFFTPPTPFLLGLQETDPGWNRRLL